MDAIEAGGKTRDCLSQPGVAWSVWHWGRELTDARDFLSEHGFGLNLIIHRPFLHAWEPEDDLNLMQTTASRPAASPVDNPPCERFCSALDATAPAFFLDGRNLWDFDDFVNDLHSIWRAH